MSRKWLYNLFLISKRRGGEDLSRRIFIVSIVVLIFCVGIFIGKKFSDGQYQTQIVRLNNMIQVAHAEKSNIVPVVTVSANDSVATVETVQDIENKIAEIQTKPVQNKVNNQRVPSSVKSVTQEPVKLEVDKVTPTTYLDKKYTVQVASEPKEEDAKEKVKELRSRDLEAFYIAVPDPKDTTSTVYRVCISFFDGYKKSMEFRSKLLGENKIDNSSFILKINNNAGRN